MSQPLLHLTVQVTLAGVAELSTADFKAMVESCLQLGLGNSLVGSVKWLAIHDCQVWPFKPTVLTSLGEAFVWCETDVLELRPDLTSEQATDVLDTIRENFDARHGIGWDTIDEFATRLFGPPTY